MEQIIWFFLLKSIIPNLVIPWVYKSPNLIKPVDYLTIKKTGQEKGKTKRKYIKYKELKQSTVYPYLFIRYKNFMVLFICGFCLKDLLQYEV